MSIPYWVNAPKKSFELVDHERSVHVVVFEDDVHIAKVKKNDSVNAGM